MTTIFTSKIELLSCWWRWWSSPEKLPPTSDMKMINIWLLFYLVVPFLEVVPRTAIECMNCSCHICESKDVNKAKVDDKKKEGDAIHGASSGEVTRVWAWSQGGSSSGCNVQTSFVIKYLNCQHKSSPDRFWKRPRIRKGQVEPGDVGRCLEQHSGGEISAPVCRPLCQGPSLQRFSLAALHLLQLPVGTGETLQRIGLIASNHIWLYLH